MAADLTSVLGAVAGIRCVVLGDAILDVWVRGGTAGLCREAPAPAVQVRSVLSVSGGAANAAVNAVALGATASLVSLVGDDPAGAALVYAARARGVRTEDVVVVHDRATLARRRIVAGGQILLRLDEGTTFPPGDAVHRGVLARLASALETADGMLISDNGHGATPGHDAGMSWPQRPPVLVVDARDPSAHAALRPTAVTPSYLDAVHMLGVAAVDSVAERVTQIAALAGALFDATAAGSVVVTLGAGGAVLLERGRAPFHATVQTGVAREVVGAGDVFAAALTCALAVGAVPPVAVELAGVAAATAAAATSMDAAADVALHATAVCAAADVRAGLRSGNKVAAGAELAELASAWHRQGRRIVFTNGCFDLVHEGHLRFLHQARALGDVLVVAVNDDASVCSLKGPERPVVELTGRMELLAALSCVDLVLPFSGPTAVGLLEVIGPHVFAKGGDYLDAVLPEAPVLHAMGTEIRILDYLPDRSTTGLIARVASRS